MRWLREPLVHFLVLGVLIFGAARWLGQGVPAADEILVTRGQQEHLVTTFARTWQRAPTAEEFNGLVEDWLKEEVAYREGLKMGLDENDTIIRRRLRQKVELLAEDLATLTEPDDAQLETWLAAHPADYQEEPRWTLRQIYFSEERRGAAARADAEQVLSVLEGGDSSVDPARLGDPLTLPQRLENERSSAVANQFGSVFAEALPGLETGRWQGPIQSGFGLHLVFIEQFVPGRPLSLAEAREALRRDWFNQQRLDLTARMYQQLLAQYQVVVEPYTASPASP